MKKVLTLTILVFLNLFFTQFVGAMKVEEIVPTDYVTDYTNTLTKDEVLEVSRILGNIEKEKGYQVAVVMIDKMEDEYGNTDYIEHFAVKLYEKLGLGTKEKDEGMLWIISKDTREMRMEVGYGLESILTDGATKNIQDNFVRPEFRNDNYYAGIKIGVEKSSDILLGMLDGEGSIPEGGQTRNFNFLSGGGFEFIIFIFIILINIFGWLFAIIARTKSWWLGGVVTFAIGAPILYFFGLNVLNNILFLIFTLTGFVFDYFVSKNYKYWQEKLVQEKNPHGPDWWAGGTWGPGSDSWTGRSGGSGWGGFGGGGMSGGGGSSSSW